MYGSVTLLAPVDLSTLRADSTFVLSSAGCFCAREGLRLLVWAKGTGGLQAKGCFVRLDSKRGEVRYYVET
jgi:hypothetical protein